MSDRLMLVRTVARWEFKRFFKLSDMIKGTIFMLIFGALGGTVATYLGRDALSVPDIAVVETGPFELADLDSPRLNFLDRRDADRDSLIQMLEEEEIGGILSIESTDQARLIAAGDRPWRWILEEFLQDARTGLMLTRLDIDEATYRQLTGEMALATEFRSQPQASRADRIVAGVAIGLVLIAVFMGFAYQFTAITAEKQQRITEQVVSAISPQTWIDGKILGITGIGLVYVVYYALISLIGATILTWFGAPFAAGLELVDPFLLALFVVLALLGILMWNAFLAGVAATIDDPNTSQKAGWMMLPLLPVGLAFFTLVNPDSALIQFLGVFPLTSYAVLPARMVMTSVAWWEIALALPLLAATAWLFRRAAGKIFAAGMMMYGKEPSYAEMWRWFWKS
ncbi:ABC transporter permease [Wenzhouxiangella sp. EGI_FJ10409]|uniref:ABC transporter permease n=1 Tax=Wenzhouxiangella sp. EGI_FJ10409 TaxID=3243767 RepID=UPI0035E1E733